MSGIMTRIDKRSKDNNYIEICDAEGYVLSTIITHSDKTELEVRTAPHLHIRKPNGWKSKQEG